MSLIIMRICFFGLLTYSFQSFGQALSLELKGNVNIVVPDILGKIKKDTKGSLCFDISKHITRIRYSELLPFIDLYRLSPDKLELTKLVLIDNLISDKQEGKIKKLCADDNTTIDNFRKDLAQIIIDTTRLYITFGKLVGSSDYDQLILEMSEDPNFYASNYGSDNADLLKQPIKYCTEIDPDCSNPNFLISN